MNYRNRIFAMLAVLMFCTAMCNADVVLPDILSDNMVLQRGVPVPIWGKADPGERVTVSFADQTRSVTADSQGRWRVALDPMKVRTAPSSMVIAGHNRVELRNVLVGEVWLCAGQSNMQRLLAETDGKDEIPLATHPSLRLFNASREVAFKRATGKLGEWQSSSPQSVKEFSAACYYFGVDLQKELNLPIGLINSSYGGSQAEAWTPEQYLLASDDLRPCVERTKIWEAERPKAKLEYEQKLEKWRAEVEQAKASGSKLPGKPRDPDALRPYRVASSIYSGMIEPLIPYAIRGAFWYQGESNEERAEQYGILLPTMIRAWRERWGQGNFPFGIIQLPNYRSAKAEPVDEPWSHIREAQRRTAMTTPNSGLIVTIDLGEAKDIHPHNKRDVGKRMCRWALAEVYGHKMVKTGPILKEAKANGSKMVLRFTEVGSGLEIRGGEKLGDFAIAGQDRQWYWAEARITGKNRVEVWSDKVPNPQAVRYAFNNNPQHANLVNDADLPASPFRTDNWPGPTDGKR